MNLKTVAISTLGCKVNQYETQAMLEMFEKNGYQIVSEKEAADVFVINTCTVTHTGDKKSRQMIRRALKNNPRAIVAVVGCYSQLEPEAVQGIQGVHVILGTQNRHRIVDEVEAVADQKGQSIQVKEYEKNPPYEALSIHKQAEMTRAYVKIQDGCNQYCSYCIIPFARGPVRSRQQQDILDEVEGLISKGYQEIVLTGIHLTSYGMDRKEPKALLGLLNKLDLLPGLERIRLGSLDPAWFDKEVIAILMNYNKLCHHFHLSLQSGTDRILKRMNRRYGVDEYMDIVKEFRKHDPKTAITTDVITGYPGETEEDFEETSRFLETLGFSEVHIFKYSPRKGTIAAADSDQIPEKTKVKRSEILESIVGKEKKKYRQQFIGKTLEVIFEQQISSNPAKMIGHTAEYLKVETKYEERLLKKMVSVKIVDMEAENLIGVVL